MYLVLLSSPRSFCLVLTYLHRPNAGAVTGQSQLLKIPGGVTKIKPKLSAC